MMTASQKPVAVGGPEGECSVMSPSSLKNTYIAVRHGHAVNNLENLISSSPAVGTKVGKYSNKYIYVGAVCGVAFVLRFAVSVWTMMIAADTLPRFS